MECVSCKKKRAFDECVICEDCIYDSMEKQCIFCHRGPTPIMKHMKCDIKRCKKCKSQFYCSVICQKNDHPFHKEICPTLFKSQVKLQHSLMKEFRCSNCNKGEGDGTHLKKCSKCHTAKYCDEICQRDHYRIHKLVCTRLSQIHALKASI